MPSQKNIDNLQVVQQKKEQSKSVVFAHYHGLRGNQVKELREKIKLAGGELVVVKNTLLRIAFGKNDQTNETLTGPTAAIFAYEDEIAPLKVVAEFAKDNELPKFTGGFFNNTIIRADDVTKLSNLPSKKELQAKVVGSISVPLYGLVNVMQGNLRNLVYALKAIGDKKSA